MFDITIENKFEFVSFQLEFVLKKGKSEEKKLCTCFLKSNKLGKSRLNNV